LNKGTYILLLKLEEQLKIKLKNKNFELEIGYYCYVGSAMKNLHQRIGRHISYKEGNYKKHWHIDNLLEVSEVKICFLIPDGIYREIEISSTFSNFFIPIKGFGASDLKIDSNLYFIENLNIFFDLIKEFI
jgi:Uri superfamily endonuclease